MSNIVIKVENLSKQYRLGSVGAHTLAHDVNRWWHWVRGKENPYLKIGEVNQRTQKANSDYVWSLNNINFEIEKGEVLGIIGKNGAGKSTLLKILSQVTSPTTGTVKVKGRIASLLEVGTGFHPELTGRENIFLNGAILGMTKSEIRSKFDEIVDFSGVEKYIDTPVKRYSSGMYVRLAFAVAAHLEPEILIIDEVLAVGDAEFQKKCLGKMKDVAGQGRTVLFVSHNMNAVSRLCTKGLLLNNGEVAFAGEVNDVVTRYLQMDRAHYATTVTPEPQEGKDICLVEASILSENNTVSEPYIDVSSSFYIYYKIKISKAIRVPHLTFHFQNSKDEFVLFSDRRDDVNSAAPTEPGTYEVKIFIKQPLLKPDRYFLSLGFVNQDNGQTNHFPSILNFEIEDLTSQRANRAGYIYVPFSWRINQYQPSV
ncbi:MAG TPA: ABC transporter ATP-binding protein [Flavobacteriales bacterium]|nr:ABC transporter ATP-binding protein [Flavobacteriales bacterium]